MIKGLSIVFALALLAVIVLAYWLNRVAIDLFLGQAFYALFAGVKILFFTALVLGVAWAVIELKRHSQVKVIKPGKHGPAQAIVHHGQVVQLASLGQTQMDPMQQLAMLRQAMQLQTQLSKFAVQEVPQLALPEPGRKEESIPAIVHYADVAEDVPQGMSLLGIHPSDGSLELASYEKLKMLWIIGSSSTGKSNTVYGKALEAVTSGAKLAVIDQHSIKDDSLTRKLEPLKGSFIRPVATDEAMTIATLQWFKAEFESRVKGAPRTQKIVLIADEINRMARSGNAEQVKLLKEVVAIGGEESRGFGMYVWCLSQKAAHLKWLRDSAITVIAHRLTMLAEAKLACNDDLAAARRLLTFPIGRTYIYGVDFDEPVELQQPLYDAPVEVESTIEHLPTTEKIPSISPTVNDAIQQGGTVGDDDFPFNRLKLKKIAMMLREKKTQQEIVTEIWEVQPNTRAFNTALLEYREMLAYMASLTIEA